MHVEIFTINEAESRGWNDMIASHPLGSVFHHTAYGKVVQATFNHMIPYYVSLISSEGVCCGGIVLFLVRSWLTGKRLVSIPWAAYGDPMVRTTEEFKILFEEILNLSRRVKALYIEINSRDSSGILKQTNLMTPSHYHNAHFLDITKGLDILWHQLHRTAVKKMIKKAKRNGFNIRLANSEEDIMLFYQLWCKHRKMLGLPAHRFEYFHNMWKYLWPLGLIQFLIAEKNGKVIGGLCNLIFKQIVFLVYIASVGDFRNLGGGNLLCWAAICEASKEGIETVDFGTTPVGVNSLKAFKERWGAKEIEVPVFYYPRVKGVSSYQDEKNLSYRAMRYFWKVAPSRLSRVASNFFWRHTG